MRVPGWVRTLTQWIKPNSPPIRQRHRRRPHVEQLEPRVLLASSLRVSDGGPTGLRASPGGTILVPVNLDISDGLETGGLALSYDTTRLEIRAPENVRRGRLLGDFDLFLANPVQQAGTIRVGFGRTAGPISGRGAGTVIAILFHVKPDAPPGPAVVNLRRDVATTLTELNEGALVLNPAPTNADTDPVDGRVNVESLAQIARAAVNDGAVQRSMVTSLTITFDKVVTFRKKAVQAFRLTGPGKVQLKASVGRDETDTRTVVQLTFRGSKVKGHSLPDGVWQLTIDGDRIFDSLGAALDADRNGTPGGDAVQEFFRLFGDGNGDRTVNATDEASLATTLGKRRRDAGYLAFFDFNNDGQVNRKDEASFRKRLGTTL